jgi:hypothetical protein
MYNKKQDPVLYCAHLAYTQDTAQDLAMYLHACAGYPVLTNGLELLAMVTFAHGRICLQQQGQSG